jgi:hypothetical protein
MVIGLWEERRENQKSHGAWPNNAQDSPADVQSRNDCIAIWPVDDFETKRVQYSLHFFQRVSHLPPASMQIWFRVGRRTVHMTFHLCLVRHFVSRSLVPFPIDGLGGLPSNLTPMFSGWVIPAPKFNRSNRWQLANPPTYSHLIHTRGSRQKEGQRLRKKRCGQAPALGSAFQKVANKNPCEGVAKALRRARKGRGIAM